MHDLVIRNGAVVLDTGVAHIDIGVEDGRIVTLSPGLTGGRDEIDAAGLHILPGVIDPHVHFNEPGRAEWEGIASGSRAFAAGGGTTYFDMPLNAHPPTIDGAAFAQKLAAASATSLVDFALWGGLVPGNLDCLEDLAACGVIGFKAFMSNSGIEDFSAVDDHTLYAGMVIAARLGRVIAVHAENDAITAGLARRAIAEGRIGARDYLASRPIVAELEAIGRAIMFAEETGCSLHVVHVSTGGGVQLVAAARARGVDVTCETCPHYLVLTDSDLERLGAVAKCAPPLRPVEESEKLWRHILGGEVSIVASDHSPSPPSLKLSGNFFEIWGGISGCQSLLQLLLTDGHAARALPLEAIARIASGNAAGRFNLGPRKGRIAIGADADLCVVDLGAETVLQAYKLLYRHAHSPYVGRQMSGSIVRTLLRGTTVTLNGAVVSRPLGRLVTPGGEQA